MDFNVIINDRNIQKEDENVISEVFSKESEDKQIKTHLNYETKITDFLSSRMDLIDDEFSNKDCRKSLILLSRQYPVYRHYSHKVTNLNPYRLDTKYRILPEIRGQNLFGEERYRSYKGEDASLTKMVDDRVDTLQKLQSSILRFGSKGEQVWMGFTGQRFQHKLVRPGFSARRYLSNLTRNLNETLIKKLMCDGYLLENNLYTSNSVMPHIRRRLSDDLSRYPEPYRILKQMLIAPGPLNEFSFVWGRKDITWEEEEKDMQKGDIKILFKKGGDNGKEEFEEVQYAELSSQKKKTILSNLLMKSAMNHALKMKEDMMEYNDHLLHNRNKERIPNINIPVIKFDMKEAITDLLTKETLQTLTTTQMELPLLQEVVSDKFKGHGLKGSKSKPLRLPEVESFTAEVPQVSVFEFNADVLGPDDTNEIEVLHPQNLTLRLNQTHFTKAPRKKKILKSESVTSKDSVSSDPNVSNVVLNPLEEGLKSLHGKADREAQGNAFAEMIRRKAQLAAGHKENIKPYGKYRHTEDPHLSSGLAIAGDIDPSTSFSNWKYKEDHVLTSGTESTLLMKSDATSTIFEENSQIQTDHSRLLKILRGQADSVADAVLEREEGGMDFTSDVNVAVRNILGQVRGSADQIWNLEVENLANEADYQGVIKNIFKSIFKSELKSTGNDDLDVSPDLLKLLQSGFNLKLEDIEMVDDPLTGKLVAVLKEGVYIPEEIKKLIKSDTVAIPTVIGKLVKVDELATRDETGEIRESGGTSKEHAFKVVEFKDTQIVTTMTTATGKVLLLQQFIEENGLVENEGLLFDKEGGYYDKEGKYFDKSGEVVDSKSVRSEQILQFSEDGSRPSAVVAGTMDMVTMNRSTNGGSVLQEGENVRHGSGTGHAASTSIGNTAAVQRAEEDVGGQKIDNEQGVPIQEVADNARTGQSVRFKEDGTAVDIKIHELQSPSLSKLSLTKEKVSDQKRKLSTKDKSNPKKKDFIFGRADETKDIAKLYSKSESNNSENAKSKKSSDKKKKTTTKKGKMDEQEKTEREDSGDMEFATGSTDVSTPSAKEETQDALPDEEVLNYEEELSDEEVLPGEGDEARRMKMLQRQERVAQKKAEVMRLRKEEEMRRKREEEAKRLENQRLALEETVNRKLEEERKRKEEEFLLQKEREKEEELAAMDAEKRKEYFRMRQIEKERQQKEEYARRKEELKMKEAIEERIRKEEQDSRDRAEAAMLAKLNEEERNEYLRKKAELLEKRRLEEEEERLRNEEIARLALEEAKALARQQAAQKALAEERMKMKIEDEGLKKYLNVSPAFVWSYFEFLNMLAKNSDASVARL